MEDTISHIVSTITDQMLQLTTPTTTSGSSFSSIGEDNHWFHDSGFHYDQQQLRYLQQANNNNTNITSNITAINPLADDKEEEEGSSVGVIISSIILFLLIFGLSGTVDCHSLKKQVNNKFPIGVGVCMQFFLMPFLGFITVKIFQTFGMSDVIAISLLVVCASPGGSYSNWWCSTFNADLSLSVAMTTVSSILAIGFLPLNLFMYSYLAFGIGGGNDDDESSTGADTSSIVQLLDFKSILTSLAVVISAVVTGLAAGYKYDTPLFHERCNTLGSISGLCLIFFSIFYSSGGSGSDSNFMNQEWTFYVGTAFPFFLGLIIINLVARTLKLSHPETVAVAIEVSYQNTGIGVSIAISMYKNDPDARAQAVAVPLFYGIISAVFICIFCIYSWKMGHTKAPADEKFCVVITKSYQGAEPGNGEEVIRNDIENGRIEALTDVSGDDMDNGGKSNHSNNHNKMDVNSVDEEFMKEILTSANHGSSQQEQKVDNFARHNRTIHLDGFVTPSKGGIINNNNSSEQDNDDDDPNKINTSGYTAETALLSPETNSPSVARTVKATSMITSSNVGN